MKVAVTERSEFIVTVQVAPEIESQPTPQPPKLWPAFGVAVSATTVPVGNGAAQVVPQFMPVGELTINPLAAPVTDTDKLFVFVS